MTLEHYMFLLTLLLVLASALTFIAKFFWWAAKYDEYLRETWKVLRFVTLVVTVILLIFTGTLEFAMYIKFW